jgi:transcriptional regulator with AAA-type ATPase domain
VRKVRTAIDAIATADVALLVQGEEGTGKELVSRLVHKKSPRHESLALTVDCAQIADNEFGDKLFGSRTGSAGGGRGLAYLDLAEGGTLILRDVEKLPISVQERLAAFLRARTDDPDSVRQNVRIVANCREAIDELALAGQVAPALAEALSLHVLVVPPLRDRKRDIPLLAEHYLRKHASRLEKPVTEFDDQAVTKLVSYDYHIANDRELEQAVERAVILTERDLISAEMIFLGPPPAARPAGVDLLKLPGLDLRGLLVRLPRIGRWCAALSFALLILVCFLGPADAGSNLATQIVWTLWWPVLVLSFFFFGRAWCAVCPIGFAGAASQRWRQSKRRIPAWLKAHDVHIAMGGLFLIVFVEEVTEMRHSPILTGLLFVVLLAGAVSVGWLYPRRTWCRHVCPLGGMAGVCSTSGLIELRPSFDVCSAKCTGHACFKGDEHVAGCPMFNHVMFVDSNQDCLLCMQCVQSCPNDSPQLNLRLPGRELWSGAAATPEFGLFVFLLAGLLTAMSAVQYLEIAGGAAYEVLLADHRLPFVGGVLALGAAAPLLFARVAGRTLAQRGEPARTKRFWRRVAAMAPLVTAGFVAYQLGYMPGLSWMSATIAYTAEGTPTTPWLSLSVLAIVRFGVLSAGLLTTAVILWRIALEREEERWTRRLRRDALLIGLHSCILGCAMLLVPSTMAALLGFPEPATPFFASQSGIFLLVLGVCYLLALRWRALVATIVVSKTLALPFLIAHAAFLDAPAIIWAAAAGDGAMLIAVLWLLRRSTHTGGAGWGVPGTDLE